MRTVEVGPCRLSSVCSRLSCPIIEVIKPQWPQVRNQKNTKKLETTVNVDRAYENALQKNPFCMSIACAAPKTELEKVENLQKG